MDTNLLMAVINQVQVMPKSSALEISESKFLNAIEGKKINEASLEDIKEVLRLVMIKIGLREQNIPNSTEINVLINHIYDQYSKHCLEEIKLAFDMAIAGSLDVDAGCYESFSCLYFSRIIKAYKEWATKAYHRIPKKNNVLIEEKKEVMDEEMEEWVEDWKNSKIENCENPMMIPPSFYPWLEKKHILRLSNEEKRDYLNNQAVTYRHYYLTEQAKMDGEHSEAKKDLLIFNTMRNEGCFKGIEIERLKELAKKIAVFDYLKSTL